MNTIQNHFTQGIRDSIPIGLGYISVSFTFGMMAVSQGIPIEVATIISLTNLTSAGQFNGLSTIIQHASLWEVAISQFIINLRYCLMSLSLSQRIDPHLKKSTKALISFGITDEIFALASSTYACVGHKYMAGLILFPMICWTLGTWLGGFASSLMPDMIRDSLGLAIYGMFLAIIIPPSKKLKNVRAVLCISIACSCLFQFLCISNGIKIVLCTLIAASITAFAYPIEEVKHD